MSTFMGIPVLTIPRWKIILLRIRYPHDWFVQRGDRVYIIRDIPTDA